MSRIREQDTERLVKALDQEIRSRGRGTIGAINTALGRSHSWWQQRVISKDITFTQLLKVLDHLGLDPTKFIRQAIGSEDGLELDRPQGEVPEIVQRAWERVEKNEEGNGVGSQFLNTLDTRKFQAPDEVTHLVHWAVTQVELELLPRLLGIAGATELLLFNLDAAEHAIYAGIRIAEHRHEPLRIGRLVCLLSSVLAERGDFQEALTLTETAAVFGLRQRDLSGVGSALVSQGHWLYNLDRPEEAQHVLRTSLEYLSDGPRRTRCAALQLTGLVHQRLGELEAAQESLLASREYLPPNDPWAEGKLRWLQAKISADLGDLEQATTILEQVVAIFRKLHFGEAALATCELVRLQLIQSHHEKAYATATSIRALIEPLRSNKIVSAALTDLLRSGRQSLTLALVDRARSRIESERQSPSWHSLKIAA